MWIMFLILWLKEFVNLNNNLKQCTYLFVYNTTNNQLISNMKNLNEISDKPLRKCDLCKHSINGIDCELYQNGIVKCDSKKWQLFEPKDNSNKNLNELALQYANEILSIPDITEHLTILAKYAFIGGYVEALTMLYTEEQVKYYAEKFALFIQKEKRFEGDLTGFNKWFKENKTK